jgi:hypothetical protein
MCNVVARKMRSIRSIKMIQYTLFIIASVLCATDMVKIILESVLFIVTRVLLSWSAYIRVSLKIGIECM